MEHPLRRCAPSPWKGDDALAAGRPLLGVPGLRSARYGGRGMAGPVAAGFWYFGALPIDG
ncbi:hypothetical protein DBV10_16755 [Acidovorax sp. FJL06]|nr:hypothetical protein DBV10_16755 [Acidovorax sp. FJL06]